jgi:para-nitrobenzyl esterase
MGLLGRITDADADWVLQAFGPGDDPGQAVRSAYPQAAAEELFTLVQSDWLFRMPSLHLAAAHVAGGGQAYLYELTYPAPAAGGIFGACHGLDISPVFGTLTAAQDFFGDTPPEEAVEVSTGMRSAWVAMAAEGHPGWPSLDHRRLTGVFHTGSTPDVQPYRRRYPVRCGPTTGSAHWICLPEQAFSMWADVPNTLRPPSH